MKALYKYVMAILLFTIVFVTNSYGQFKLVGDAGSGGFNNAGSNRYSATIVFRPDLTGNYYDGTDVLSGYKLFTSSEQMYTIINVSSTTYNTASVTIQADTILNTNSSTFYGVPSGQVLIYDSSESEGALQVPFGSVGASARMQAAVDSWNIKVISNLLSKTVNVEPSFLTDIIRFNINTDSVGTEEGHVIWNAEDHTLDIHSQNGAVLQVNQEMVIPVKNKSGVTIENGMPVRFAGTEGASSRLLVQAAVADGSYPVYYNLGTATNSIPHDSTGLITVFGKVRGIDLDGISYLNCNDEEWIDGTLLYLDPVTEGCYTSIMPSAPNNKVLYAAIVAAKNNGTMMVRPSLFYDIRDLNGVNIVNEQDGQVIAYNANSNVWENTTIDLDTILTQANDYTDSLHNEQIGMGNENNVPTYDSEGNLQDPNLMILSDNRVTLPREVKLTPLTTAQEPVNAEGLAWYNTTTDEFRVSNGTLSSNLMRYNGTDANFGAFVYGKLSSLGGSGEFVSSNILKVKTTTDPQATQGVLGLAINDVGSGFAHLILGDRLTEPLGVGTGVNYAQRWPMLKLGGNFSGTNSTAFGNVNGAPKLMIGNIYEKPSPYTDISMYLYNDQGNQQYSGVGILNTTPSMDGLFAGNIYGQDFGYVSRAHFTQSHITSNKVATDPVTYNGYAYNADWDYSNIDSIGRSTPGGLFTHSTYAYRARLKGADFIGTTASQRLYGYYADVTDATENWAIYVENGDTKLENYILNTDQDTTGKDSQALRFNSSTGEIELQPDPPASKSYVQLFYNTAYNLTQGSYNKLTGGNASLLQDFTVTDSTITYIGTGGIFEIDSKVNVLVTAGGSGEFFLQSEVYINNVGQNETEVIQSATEHGGAGSVAINNYSSTIVELSTGDVIDLRVSPGVEAGATFTNVASVLKIIQL